MEKLRKLRIDSGIKVKAIAITLGISNKAIYQYERGERFPDKNTLKKLAQFYNCSIDDLIN